MESGRVARSRAGSDLNSPREMFLAAQLRPAQKAPSCFGASCWLPNTEATSGFVAPRAPRCCTSQSHCRTLSEAICLSKLSFFFLHWSLSPSSASFLSLHHGWLQTGVVGALSDLARLRAARHRANGSLGSFARQAQIHRTRHAQRNRWVILK